MMCEVPHHRGSRKVSNGSKQYPGYALVAEYSSQGLSTPESADKNIVLRVLAILPTKRQKPMYLDYFHLTREPFLIEPDSAFLFLSEKHKQALATMKYGIEMKKGFVAITGPVGVGKTTIARSYLENLNNQLLKVIYISNASTTFENLMEAICRELGITVTPDAFSETVRNVHLFLIDEYKAGRTIAFIIDEAQNMPVETLKNLHMLSNLETTEDKLIQIVFVGQPELDELLGKHELRQVKQRIAMRTVIGGFTAKESMAYIAHRLRVAGAETESILRRAALRKIAKESKGVPRIINILCDNALSTARRYDLKMVTGKVVKEVTAEFNGQERRHRPGWGLAVSMLAFCLIALFFLIFRYGRFGSPVAQKSPDKAVRVASAPSISLTDPGRAMPQADPGATKDEAIIKQTNPPAAPQQADARAKTGQAQTKIIAKRTVEWGDSLSRLTTEVYGRSAAEVLNFVKDNNPHIKDLDNLRVGSVVNFPEVPKNLSVRGRAQDSPVAQKAPDKAVRVTSAPSISLTDPGRAMPQADPGATKDEAIIKQTNPPAAPQQADARAKTGQAQTKIIAKRTVEWGDSLSKLTEDVYGRSSYEVLKYVKDNNPSIKDMNNLRMGSVVNFPELPKSLSVRGRVSMSAR